MKAWLLLALLALQVTLSAQSPVRKTLAYSRATLSGIPGESPHPPAYFIYVVVQRGTALSPIGVCVLGTRHDAVLRKVASPVVTEHDPNVRTGKRDTLVGKTSDDVYQVDVGEPKGPCGTDHPAGELAQRNEVVVCLKSSGSTWYGLASKIVPLAHVAAP